MPMNTKSLKQVLINSLTVMEMWLNNTLVYNSALWYGVKFTGSSVTGTRTGNTSMHKSLPILSNMKGCTITSDGTVKYLKPNDWTKYEDGTARDMALNTMVEIPQHYRMFIASGNDAEIRISPYALEGYVEVKKQYVSAYETYCTGGVAKSIKGNVPTVNTSRESFLTQSRANGSDHWNMYTYEAHKALTWLFVVEYANRNSLAAVNAALTSEGYKQGGLGNGCTIGAVGGAYAFIPAGHSDALGNGSGEISWTNGTDTRMCNRYRGVENPFGHVWKNTIDVIVTGTDNKVYKTKDYTLFGNDKTKYTYEGLHDHTSAGYVTQVTPNADGDLFPSVIGGNTTTYYCDYHWTNPVDTDRLLLLGARADDGGNAGWFYLHSYVGLGYVSSTVGSRLTYLL